MKLRKFVIGDIHGAFRALEQLLARLPLQKHDILIFTGDYVDGWPESSKVIDRLIELSLSNPCVFIKGNHDVGCASWLSGKEADEGWLNSKQESMIDSYKFVSQERRKQHAVFFSGMRDYFIDSDNRLFIHAGFTSLKGPSEEIFGYNFNNDRTLLETALALDKEMSVDSIFYPKRLKLFREIFIGHTPTTKYGVSEPINAANLWDVDTGASYHGKITALDVDTKEYWQSDAVKELYPVEINL